MVHVIQKCKLINRLTTIGDFKYAFNRRKAKNLSHVALNTEIVRKYRIVLTFLE